MSAPALGRTRPGPGVRRMIHRPLNRASSLGVCPPRVAEQLEHLRHRSLAAPKRALHRSGMVAGRVLPANAIAPCMRSNCGRRATDEVIPGRVRAPRQGVVAPDLHHRAAVRPELGRQLDDPAHHPWIAARGRERLLRQLAPRTTSRHDADDRRHHRRPRTRTGDPRTGWHIAGFASEREGELRRHPHRQPLERLPLLGGAAGRTRARSRGGRARRPRRRPRRSDHRRPRSRRGRVAR